MHDERLPLLDLLDEGKVNTRTKQSSHRTCYDK
jgi:hypothetical protein